MRLENSFTVERPIETTWGLLLDVPAIAPCIPGVRLTEVVDERTFRGIGEVRLGPVQLALAGEARLDAVDAIRRTMTIRGKGRDAKGRGGTEATVEIALAPLDAARTRVSLRTELELSGAIAQYGRASGIIHEVARQITAQFAANLDARLAAEAPNAAPSTAAAKPAPSLLALVLRAFAALVRARFNVLFGRR